MPYVQRDGSGSVVGIFANPQPGYATEFLADSDPAVLAYLNPRGPAQVDAERDRRIALGVSVTMSDNSSFVVQTRDVNDRLNITGFASTASVLKAAGSNATLVFRDAANVNHTLSLTDAISLGTQVEAAIAKLYADSWALKGGAIPADYTADKYWT